MEPRPRRRDHRAGLGDAGATRLEPVLRMTGELPAPPDHRAYLPAVEPERQITDWGRSERVETRARQDALRVPLPLLVPGRRSRGSSTSRPTGGALLVSNHAGALPPDAAMIAKAIKTEHPRPRPLHLTVEHFFKGYPGLSHARRQARRRPRAPRQRPPPALRRGAARARLPRGPQGHREALQGPLPAAALRPRRLRRVRDEGAAPRSSRSRSSAPRRRCRSSATSTRSRSSPASSTSRSRRRSRCSACSAASPTCRRSSTSASWSRSRPTSGARSRGRTRASCRRSPRRSAAGSRRSSTRCSPTRRSVWLG